MTNLTLSPALQEAVQKSNQLAVDRHHAFMTLDHVLLTMLSYPDVAGALETCGADVSAISKALNDSLSHAELVNPDNQEKSAPSTVTFWRIMQNATAMASAANRSQVDFSHVLVAMYEEDDTMVQVVMAEQGVTLENLKRAVSVMNKDISSPGSSSKSGAVKGEWLEKYAVNLNALAREGKIDPLIGRDDEIQRMIQVLCRRRKNNPLLVGEPGVGKTALAEGLAGRIVAGKVPQALLDAEVYTVDIAGMIAGARFRGDFEERLKGLVAEVESRTNVVLFIDEIHTVIGAGSTGPKGGNDAANMIKPSLASGKLRLIGATTFTEFRSLFDRDGALSRRFQKVEVGEPSRDDAVAILRGLSESLESHHGVTYQPGALEAAVDLSVRYLPDRLLPDKAIDLLDEAGARARLLTVPSSVVTVDDIKAVVASIARIPVEQATTGDRAALKALDGKLKAVVFGQDKALDSLAAAVRMNRAGLAPQDKPIGSFMFAGPTGVGKTETARQLALELGLKLVRFDMSEYREQHSVSRLIGAPPGYVGHEQAGQLTEAIAQNPHCVLLFDEFEKAHPDIHAVLLQVMDAGRLTDSTGRVVDFRNTILIMTTNAGASATSKRSMGFLSQDNTTDAMELIRTAFAPEFRNRLDEIVWFSPLTTDHIENIVRKFLGEVSMRALEQGIEVSFSNSVVTHIAEVGFDPEMGARPLSRVIRDKVRRQLSDKILFEDLGIGTRVSVDFVDGEVVLTSEQIVKTEDNIHELTV